MVISTANVLIIFAIAFMVWKKDHSEVRIYFWPALLFRVLAGVALGVLYKHYYGFGDTLGYDVDALKLSGLASRDFARYLQFLWDMSADATLADELVILDPRALFFTKWISLFYLISGGSYWLSATYLSLLSFLSSWSLVRAISVYRPELRSASVLAFLFFPSIVFWSSGLIKESLAMACLFFIVKVFLKLYDRRNVSVSQWVVLPFSLWILWGLKYYYLAVLLPVAITTLVMQLLILPKMRLSSKWLRGIAWLVVFVVPLGVATIVHPNFYPERFLEVIVYNYEVFMRISHPSDVVHFPTLAANGWSILMNAPKAIYSGVFRPFIWEASNALQILSALENMVLIVMLVVAVRRYRGKDVDRLLLPCLVYCVLLCVFLTLSTPNFGTLSRYRVGFLPFLVLVLAGSNDWVKTVDTWVQRLCYRLAQ